MSSVAQEMGDRSREAVELRWWDERIEVGVNVEVEEVVAWRFGGHGEVYGRPSSLWCLGRCGAFLR